MGKRMRWVWTVVVLVIGATAVAMSVGSTSSKGVAHRDFRAAKFNRNHGGEADRESSSTPAAEQVGDRAYPRSYVDDRRAVRARHAYESLATASAARRTSSKARLLPPSTPWTE